MRREEGQTDKKPNIYLSTPLLDIPPPGSDVSAEPPVHTYIHTYIPLRIKRLFLPFFLPRYVRVGGEKQLGRAEKRGRKKERRKKERKTKESGDMPAIDIGRYNMLYKDSTVTGYHGWVHYEECPICGDREREQISACTL